MITLYHEDIDVFVDPVELVTLNESGSTYSVINDSIKTIGDLGKMTITVTSGSFTQLVIDMGYDTLTIDMPLPLNSVLVLDFNKMQFTLDGSPIFLNSLPVIQNNVSTTINFYFTGTGTSTLVYEYLKPTINNDSVQFVTSLDAVKNTEIKGKTNLFAKNSYTNTAKKDYQWSINGLCNETEIAKFKGIFRLRLVDLDGTELETLANCHVLSLQKGSTELTDYTFSITGLCEEIF